MGAIQNTVNAMLGATAGAVVGIEKMQQAKLAQGQQEIKLTEQIPALKEQIAKTGEELKGAEANVAKAETGRNERGQFKTKEQTNKDIMMAKLARDTIVGKQEAMKLQLESYQKQFERIRGSK